MFILWLYQVEVYVQKAGVRSIQSLLINVRFYFCDSFTDQCMACCFLAEQTFWILMNIKWNSWTFSCEDIFKVNIMILSAYTNTLILILLVINLLIHRWTLFFILPFNVSLFHAQHLHIVFLTLTLQWPWINELLTAL